MNLLTNDIIESIVIFTSKFRVYSKTLSKYNLALPLNRRGKIEIVEGLFIFSIVGIPGTLQTKLIDYQFTQNTQVVFLEIMNSGIGKIAAKAIISFALKLDMITLDGDIIRIDLSKTLYMNTQIKPYLNLLAFAKITITVYTDYIEICLEYTRKEMQSGQEGSSTES